jgi:NhaD family Na+/H+ antiporter
VDVNAFLLYIAGDMLYILLSIFFSLGYLAIILEKFLHVNKAAVALIMGAFCWLLYFVLPPQDFSIAHITKQIYDVAQIIFFLLAVMVIVELIDSHHGFKLITDLLYTASKRRMLWFLIGMGFFMSAVLDNLTTMIVMVSLLKKLIPDQKERWLIGSLLVITVNAGGAWTPIGDVTTTMLWINDKLTTWVTIHSLFLPSVACTLVAGLLGSCMIRGKNQGMSSSFHLPMETGARRVFLMGIGALIMIPVLKAVFNLPPFLGALMGLGLLWLATDIIHYRHAEERWHLKVVHILTKIDTSGILFFLGILLAIDALTEAGILKDVAVWLEHIVPNPQWIAVLIGLASSIIDNVPLVAASIGMYDVTHYPVNSSLWQMIAYAAGTGGSILIIGSAAGVAFMGLEKVDFIWYFKRISWIALISYFVGFFVYFVTTG